MCLVLCKKKKKRCREHPEEGSWDYKDSKHHAFGELKDYECSACEDWSGVGKS